MSAAIRARPDVSTRAKLEREVRTLEQEREDVSIVFGAEAWRIRDRLSEARERLRAFEDDFCNCVICGGGPEQCQVAPPSPREWLPEPVSELERRITEQVEGERHRHINDESEASNERG